MNAPKPNKSLAGTACRECDEGHFEFIQIDHVEKISNDNPVTVPRIWVNRCTHCGETVFPAITVQYIESVVAEQTERLTGNELERIREDLGIERQDEMSEILGLGTKTFHKWESGAQFPTRSMSYYIRILSEFPQSFDWLRRRTWRNRNRVLTSRATADFNAMFPDLLISEPSFARPYLNSPSSQTRANPARGLTRVAFISK